MPTSDLELIERTIKHPRVYPRISDDFSEKMEDWKPKIGDDTTYLAMYDDSTYFGLVVLVEKNPICYEIHSCLLPSAYGAAAVGALAMAIDWAWMNTQCRRLVAGIPEDNSLAYKLAKNVGMSDYGYDPGCTMRHGRILGMRLVGISREGVN